jgi:ethanolamine transporter EutH
MHWQDPVLTAAQISFTIALFPSIMSRDKPALATSLLNGTVAAVISCIYATLSLWFAAVSAAVNSAFWLLLAVQKRAADRRQAG